MVQFVPVEHDPFTPQPKLTPVEHDPFAAPKNGFTDRVGKRFSERNKALEAASQNPNFPGGSAGLMYNAIGQTLQKGLNDVPAEAIVSMANATPQPVKNFGKDVYSNFKNTPAGYVLDPAIRGAGYVLGQASEGYDKFKRNNPNAGLYFDSTLGFGNAALAMLPVKGESVPSRAVSTGQKAVGTANKTLSQKIAPLQKYSPDISPDAIRSIGGQLIGKAEKAGAVIKPEAATGFIDDIVNKIKPKGRWASAAAVRTEVDDIVENLSSLRGQAMSLDDAMELESSLGKLAYAPKNYSMGKFSPEGLKLREIQGSLADMIDNAAEAGLVTGDEAAVSSWREGQKYWSASIRARELSNIIENSQYMDHPATAIKTGMRNIIKNKNKFNKYSAKEKILIRQAAKTGIVTDFYRLGASGLGPIGAGIVGGAAGAVGGGPIGAAVGSATAAGASYAGREASKAIATSRQMAKANKAYNAVAAEAVGIPTKRLSMKQIMDLAPEQRALYLKNIKASK